MSSAGIFQFIGQTITNATNVFVQPTVSNLMLELKMTALAGVTLYIVITGYAISTGSIESPFWTFAKQCLKIIIITFFALTADGYINGVMEAINGLENGLSQVVCKSNNINGQQLSIYELLDQSLDKNFEIVEYCWKRADTAGLIHIFSALGWLLAGLIVAISAVYVNVLGGTTIIVAKFSLMVMFALGPLFIMCLMFPITARFFDNWFSQVMNYILTIVIMAIVMAFAIKAYDAFIGGTNFSDIGDVNPITVALQVCALSGVLGWIISQAGGMASGLAGGLSMAAMTVGQFAAPVLSSMSAAKKTGNIINPQKTRRDMTSGKIVTASRASHLLAGNTMLNPAYRQSVKENLTNNWGKAKGGDLEKGKEKK